MWHYAIATIWCCFNGAWATTSTLLVSVTKQDKSNIAMNFRYLLHRGHKKLSCRRVTVVKFRMKVVCGYWIVPLPMTLSNLLGHLSYFNIWRMRPLKYTKCLLTNPNTIYAFLGKHYYVMFTLWYVPYVLYVTFVFYSAGWTFRQISAPFNCSEIWQFVLKFWKFEWVLGDDVS